MQKQSALYRIMTYNDRILAFLVVMTVKLRRGASLIRRRRGVSLRVCLQVTLRVSGWCMGGLMPSMQKPAELAIGMGGEVCPFFLEVVEEIGEC